jgi:hypothetical protein
MCNNRVVFQYENIFESECRYWDSVLHRSSKNVFRKLALNVCSHDSLQQPFELQSGWSLFYSVDMHESSQQNREPSQRMQ